MLTTIRQGSHGPLVVQWQDFLRGHGLYLGTSDGNFGSATKLATERYQGLRNLNPIDGIVGNSTWGRAMVDGFQVVGEDGEDKDGPNWPPKPDFGPASWETRFKLFGKFSYVPAPTTDNPEGIKILGDWVAENIVSVVVPQLRGVEGAPKSGKISWHKAAVDQLLGLWQAWEDAGLLRLVRSYGGSWNPRFTRGSNTSLSNHSLGTAFDICVPWNMLARRPALVGQPGSVRELVPLANERGFFWGGHYQTRPDGMHFEVAWLVSPSPS
jgi:hypothetical protein